MDLYTTLKATYDIKHYNKVAEVIGRVVISYFDKLPKDVRNELLLKLEGNKRIVEFVARAVASNFDKLLRM